MATPKRKRISGVDCPKKRRAPARQILITIYDILRRCSLVAKQQASCGCEFGAGGTHALAVSDNAT